MDDAQFSGQTALITGGAQGIGFEMAKRFGAGGARIVLADLQGEKAVAAAAELSRSGIEAFGFPVDVTNNKSVLDLKKAIAKDVGKITMLVNNAGIVHGGLFREVPLKQHLTTYEVNIGGVVRVTHAFLDDLLESPKAYLVNIASASGLIGLPYGSTYASSKWAAIGFSESLRLEFQTEGHHNISVTTVCPSYISTGMFKGVRTPRATGLLTPGKIADIVVEATWKEKEYVLEPFMIKLVGPLKGMLPLRMFDKIAEAFKLNTSMRSWRGHES